MYLPAPFAEDRINESTRQVSGFHDVVLRVHARLKLRQGDIEGLSITGDDNIVPLVETAVEDGKLIIRWAGKRNYSTSYKDLELVVDAKSDRVLGCHVLGPDAGEIVQIAAIAMRMGARKADFDATMALHPSASEELVTMRTKWTPPA